MTHFNIRFFFFFFFSSFLKARVRRAPAADLCTFASVELIEREVRVRHRKVGEKIVKILNTHATVIVRICTVIIAIVYLCIILHSLV